MKHDPRAKNNSFTSSDAIFPKGRKYKHIEFQFPRLAITVLFFLVVFHAEAFALSVSLSWSPSTSNVDGYRIYYKDGVQGGAPYDGTHANEGNSPLEIGNATHFTITGLETGRNYYFVITAYKDNVESSFSNEVCLFGGPVIKSIKINR